MINMPDEDHRAYTVAGLHKLADFLYEYDIAAPLNTASRIDVHYTVLEEDDNKAREEYRALAEFMEDVIDRTPAGFRSESIVYGTNTHHIADLTFGAGTVAYRAVWIEKTKEAGQ